MHRLPFADLETPALLVERRILEDNATAMQQLADSAGVTLRPHAKTHKSPELARLQVEMGAGGVTVATLTEAECMADEGIDDIFVAYPPVGPWRVDRLRMLLSRASVIVGVESAGAVRALAKLGADVGRDVPFRWEIDSGLGRLGSPPGQPAVDAIQTALDEPNTLFDGIFTHAGHSYRAESRERIDDIARGEARCLLETAEELRRLGVTVRSMSVGSTPTARVAARVPGVTEIRPGTYIYNDATQVALGVAEPADCAQSVLATVVGRPTPDRVVVDSGSKALPPENPSGRATGWGIVLGHPDLVVERLYEEHGVLRSPTSSSLDVGDRVRIIPNHACTTTNLHARLNVVDGDEVVRVIHLRARNWHRADGDDVPNAAH
jgi:D-serine deaminase-like pyridoxal phosphate-dependent protein